MGEYPTYESHGKAVGTCTNGLVVSVSRHAVVGCPDVRSEVPTGKRDPLVVVSTAPEVGGKAIDPPGNENPTEGYYTTVINGLSYLPPPWPAWEVSLPRHGLHRSTISPHGKYTQSSASASRLLSSFVLARRTWESPVRGRRGYPY